MYKSIYVVLFLLLLVETSFSQEYFESNTIVKNLITYNSLSDSGYGNKIFNLLGLENNLSVQKIKLETKSRLLLRISRNNDNKYTAKISLTRVGLTGNTNLHDFNIDSLLWPTGFTAKLTIYNGKHKLGNISISASADGKLNVFDLNNNIKSSFGDVNATISDIEFYFDDISYQKIQNISKTIGYYYSYSLLLNNLIDVFSQNVKNNSETSENIFLDKIIIDRVKNNIANYKFASKLNLDTKDPESFLKLQRKLHRLSSRAETLFNQQIQGSKQDNGIPLEFCASYSKISINFLGYAKNLQPSNALAFEETAKIEVTELAKNNLKNIIEFYCNQSGAKSKELYQDIFNNFVSMAKAAISNDNYTDAILLLNNALIIHNWVNANLTSEYSSMVSFALDGVASSYLSVGFVALRAQNNALATKYFNNADEIVMSNKEIFESIQHSDTAFSNYLGLQCKIALSFIEDQNYNRALIRLSYGENICSKLVNSTACNLIDSITCIARSGIINVKLDSLKVQISNGQFPDAYERLADISQYINDKNCIDKVDSSIFVELSYSLFIEFLQRGEILIDAQQSKMALYNLLKAKSIQEKYLSEKIEKLTILIKFAAEPEITKLIDQAKYHTWANRMDEATHLSIEAKKLTSLYFGNTNNRINKALIELDNQMISRNCISYKIKYDDAIKKVLIAIKYNNYNKLNALLVEAQTYVNDYPECAIQNDEVLELSKKYNTLIEYYKRYEDVTNKLFLKGYNDAIDRYIALSVFFNNNNLEKYNISFPSVRNFILAQNLPKLTMTTASYYVDNGNADLAFDFLKIYKDQGGDSKSIKSISNKIAGKLALRDEELEISAKDALRNYTDGDKWYNSFKIAYLKNRIVH